MMGVNSLTALRFNGLFSRTTWMSWYQKGKTSLDLKRQETTGFWDAVASAGPYANNLHLTPDNHTNTSSFSFYRPDALPDSQPTASKH